MSDKAEYKAVLTIINSTTTTAAKANKLSKLSIESEDPMIKRMCDALGDTMRKSGNLPQHLPSLIAHLKQQLTRSGYQDDLVRVVDNSIKVCTAAMASVEPQWMRTARAAGWTPPSP